MVLERKLIMRFSLAVVQRVLAGPSVSELLLRFLPGHRGRSSLWGHGQRALAHPGFLTDALPKNRLQGGAARERSGTLSGHFAHFLQ